MINVGSTCLNEIARVSLLVTKRRLESRPSDPDGSVLRLSPYHIMSIPPIPPMPPGIAGASFFGSSA
ncbi:hypothetical protein, partial [Sinorhizobium meliloti]|uniref:hypothetical protein n=1 Tax=Rhizobium meliloti TaxID=382 RepID=UPI001AEC74BD